MERMTERFSVRTVSREGECYHFSLGFSGVRNTRCRRCDVFVCILAYWRYLCVVFSPTEKSDNGNKHPDGGFSFVPQAVRRYLCRN